MTSVLRRGKLGYRDTQGMVLSENETAVRVIQAEELQGLPATSRSWKGQGAWLYGHLDLRLLASRTGRQYMLMVLGPPVCGTLFLMPSPHDLMGLSLCLLALFPKWPHPSVHH